VLVISSGSSDDEQKSNVEQLSTLFGSDSSISSFMAGSHTSPPTRKIKELK
jgi:hypothetical protein